MSAKQLLDQVSPLHLALGMGVLSLVTITVGTCRAYRSDTPLPAVAPLAPLAEKAAATSYRYKKGYFRSQIEEDCQRLKIRRIGVEALRQPNSYKTEFDGEQRLRAGKKLQTNSLLLRATRRKLWVGEEGRGMRAPHLLLQIANRTPNYLAYRVTTSVKGDCGGKAILAHNALALEPKGRAVRTECISRGKLAINVHKIEVLEVTPLGYHYISRLDPLRLRFDHRTAEGHRYHRLSPCRLIPWRTIDDGLRRDDLRWYDVVDFYSRHTCEEYTYFAGYRMATKPIEKLPVKPPASKGD